VGKSCLYHIKLKKHWILGITYSSFIEKMDCIFVHVRSYVCILINLQSQNLLLPPFLVESDNNVSASCVEVLEYWVSNSRIILHITSDFTDGKTQGITSSVGDTVAQIESHNFSTDWLVGWLIYTEKTVKDLLNLKCICIGLFYICEIFFFCVK